MALLLFQKATFGSFVIVKCLKKLFVFKMKQQTKRIIYLDSVRGIAALMVVFYHFMGWHWGDTQSFHLWSFLFNGADAVSFFFVLSGFVLSYKYLHSDAELNIKKYTFNRFLRLYPAYIVTILLNYLYWNRHQLGFNLITDIFTQNVALWNELIMVKNQHMYYVPGWTLGIEMALSLLMPILIIAARRNKQTNGSGIRLIKWLIPFSLFIGTGYISGFTIHFCLGIILAYYYPSIKTYNFKESKYHPYRWLIGLLVFLLFSIRHIERLFDFGPTYDKIAGFLRIDLFHYTAVASFAILLFIINNEKTQRALSGKVMNFIGEISYSVYLSHWLIVVIIMERWDKIEAYFGSHTLAYFSMLAVAVITTLITATLMYYFIEKPFIRLSKRISSKF